MSIKIKIFILTVITLLNILPVYADGVLGATPALKNYKTSKIPSGLFIKCILLREISSEVNKEGDIVTLQNPVDICVEGKILIPKNTIFTGRISQLSKAVEGQNGWFRFNIEKAIFPNENNSEIHGELCAHMLTTHPDGIIGGEFSPRTKYRKVVHRSKGFKSGVAQLLPDGPRILGKETKLKAGTDIMIQLDKDFYVLDLL
jgi:hypothetical protein